MKIIPGFDAKAFRDAITFAMQMGMPENEIDRATFVWDTITTYDVPVDPAGRPYDLTAEPTTTIQHPDTQVNVAVEVSPASPIGTALGQIDPPKVKLTLLDVDFDQVKGSKRVLLGQDTYVLDYVEPPISLDGVTVYIIHGSAVDEN